MKLKIHQKILIGLLVPILITAACIFYQLKSFTSAYQMIHLIESSDDINIILLEIRRHEKNILLFNEKMSESMFYENLEVLKRKIREIKVEIINNIGESTYKTLLINLSDYENKINFIISNRSHAGSDYDMQVREIRVIARAIEEPFVKIKRTERKNIDEEFTKIKTSFITSFVILIIALSGIGYLFSKRLLQGLKAMQRSFEKLGKGQYSKIFNVDGPYEILSLIDVYNSTIRQVETSKKQLNNTLKELELVNSEILKKQDILVEVKKAAAMKLLASEISHEINNPMSSLNMMLGLLYEELNENDPKKENVSFMLGELQRCNLIIEKLTAFAKKEQLNLRDVSLKEIIYEVSEIVSKQNVEKGITLTLNIDALPLEVTADNLLIQNALINLLSNAYEAIPAGGVVEVTGQISSDYAIILVSDTGEGISEENLSRIFEPFFTTKEQSGGIGIGLSLVRKIIQRHGGKITVNSTLGKGAVFAVHLPLKNK
ncbi:MAG: HAMP domain-containing histidine kinase [Nitrospirae bacterium]|nr:HAMP domain-containing histidine kinase [Nitrospirota bacterium]MBF0536116.1 HAMP domain-containing histidine kinase [Nitrospirota bacterium]MBF0616852.1 HAMP domain-containing histidine kinase [Nitrospirota bacterium]